MPTPKPAPLLRELRYEVRAPPEAPPAQLPLLLARQGPGATIETTVAHLDDDGRVWRILNVQGPAAAVDAAQEAFESYAPPFVAEKWVMGRSPERLILWYKYRLPRGGEGFSHTALAFGMLGRDTVVTDRTRGEALEIRILARRQPALAAFVAAVRKAPGVRILYSGPVRPEGTAGLTAKEEEALRVAWKAGYYAKPRKAGVREVGRLLKAPATTAGYRLRSAEAKLVGARVG